MLKLPLSLEQIKEGERKVERWPPTVQRMAGELGSLRERVPGRCSLGLVQSWRSLPGRAMSLCTLKQEHHEDKGNRPQNRA